LDLSEVRRDGAQRHPWEIARLHALVAILRRHPASMKSILDVGCGDGFIGESLLAAFDARELVGVDLHLAESACGVYPAPNHVIERYQSEQALGDRRFDLILALDVLEHVDDDRALLREVVARRAQRGGRVLVTVPAFQVLFSDHDRALHHYRRYTSSDLRSVVADAGLEILDDGYVFLSLLAPRFVAMLRERGGRQRTDHGAGVWRGPAWLTRLIGAALILDAEALLAIRRLGIRVPGLTAWALCAAR
jgi:SAM-dependent methyltransferase